MAGAEGDFGSGDGAVLGVVHDGVDLAEVGGLGDGGGEKNDEEGQKLAQWKLLDARASTARLGVRPSG